MSNAEAVKKYQEKRDSIMLRPSKEDGQTIRAAAAAAGMSVQAYVLRAVRAWMEQERVGAAPTGSSPMACPEDTEGRSGVVLVSAGGSPTGDIYSRSPPLTPPDSTTGLVPAPKQESLADVAKRLSAMTPEERDKAMGCDDESMERYRERMEYKRKRLAELTAKAGGLSRAEEMERRRLMGECSEL